MRKLVQLFYVGTFLRFLVSGVVNTGVTYGLFLFLGTYLHHSLAYTATFAVGVALAYVLAAGFVFDAGYGVRSASRFMVVYVVQYVYGLTALMLLVDWLSVSRELAMALVIVSNIPLTFYLTRRVLMPAREALKRDSFARSVSGFPRHSEPDADTFPTVPSTDNERAIESRSSR